jgi:hypothetical protein
MFTLYRKGPVTLWISKTFSDWGQRKHFAAITKTPDNKPLFSVVGYKNGLVVTI